MPAIVGLSRAELTLLVRNRTQLFLALAFPPAITVFFAALWLIAAWLFRRSARVQVGP